jgi:hypothetical protein
MNILLNSLPFNYQNDIQLAKGLSKQDSTAAKFFYNNASKKKKCLEQMNQLMDSINFHLLPYSLTQSMLMQDDSADFAKTLMCACINILNTTHHIDERNQSTFAFFKILKLHISSISKVSTDFNDYKNAGISDPVEFDKLNSLKKLFNEIGSIDDASSVFASCLLKTHPTLQQLFARALRNSMLEITARKVIHGEEINPELLEIAKYIASCGQSIPFPYI